MNTLLLNEKTCLITGASGGIGLSTTKIYLEAGAKVIATDINNSEQIDELKKLHNSKLEFFIADISKEDGIEKCKDMIKEHNVCILFNNAAIFDMSTLLESSIEQYEKIFNINVKAMFLLMQAVATHLDSTKQIGSIINLSSQAGRRGEALVSHYCASKSAVISYTQSAALALAKQNIRVNAIAPGVIDTPMWEFVDAKFAKYENLPIGEKKKQVGQAVPMGRMGEPIDVAKVALFLACDLSSYITGQTINVDGGSVLN